jgi:carbamoyl-phosphate synthase small subunit
LILGEKMSLNAALSAHSEEYFLVLLFNLLTNHQFLSVFPGMVGYIESLTDPSYRGQILVLSYPMIGNYGVPSMEVKDKYGLPAFFESEKIQIAGLVVLDYSQEYSHWNAVKSLSAWLKESGVPAIFGVDTRAVIKRLRNHGVMLGMIVQHGIDTESRTFSDPNSLHLVAEVSTKKVLEFGSGDKTVIVVDCGMKTNQLRNLLARGLKVKVVPWDYDFVSDNSWDGLFISNGPGDPTMCTATISNLRKVIQRFQENPAGAKPVFGICLGNQLLGLAAGAKTFKLKFGNRGHNQPCVDVTTGRCHLTSQNHGFAIDTETLPAGWKQYFYNANDNTNEGIMHESLPIFSVQFHPEARGGPCETEYLFDLFASRVQGKSFDHPLNKTYKEAQAPKSYSKVLILGTLCPERFSFLILS